MTNTSPYDPLYWYWTVTDTNPSTHVFSSASGTYVVLADATYVAWLALGNTPTTMDTNVGMRTLINQIALSRYNPASYAIMSISADTTIPLPVPNWLDVLSSSSTNKLMLPQSNLTNSLPIGTIIVINNVGGINTIPIYDYDGVFLGVNIPVLHTYLFCLRSNYSTGGAWIWSGAFGPGTIPLTDTHLLVGGVGNIAFDVALSGDATLANTGALTLASTIAAGGPTGSATVTPIITYDAKGRLTTVSSATIAPAATSITGTLGADHGGTGIANNAASTITISGNFAITFTVTAATGITLPITGTLSTLAGAEELTNKTLNASVGKGTWTASGTWVLPAHTLGGTISGGGNQINNVIIGTTTPLAGTFTVLTGTSGSITGLTTLAIRDTTAAFDVTIAATSVPNISAGRTLTIDMGNVANTLSFGAWIAYAPAITATTGTFTTVASDGVYKVFGKTVFFRVKITITTIGSAAGRMLVAFPTGTPASTAGYAMLLSGANQTSHKAVIGQVFDSLTLISVNLYDGTFPGTSGEIITVAGFYELA